MAEEGAVSESEEAVVKKETMSKTEEIGAKPNIKKQGQAWIRQRGSG